MADELIEHPTTQKAVPTEMEHALATAKFFVDVYKEITKGFPLETEQSRAIAIEAAKLATQNSVRHYHYVLEAAGKAAGGAGPDKATEKQVATLNTMLSQRRLFLDKPDYAALKGGNLTKSRASEILDKALNKNG